MVVLMVKAEEVHNKKATRHCIEVGFSPHI